MMNATEVLATFENAEDGIKSYVAKVSKGYSVSLQDTDSGEFVPVSIIYPDVERAILKAKEII